MNATYDKPLVLSYAFPAVDFGASNVTRLLAVPILSNGRKPGGKVIGATLHNITEDFAGSSSDASVQVGISGDINKYFQSADIDETADIGETLFLVNTASDAVDIERNRDDITVTFVAAVGTPTGIADVALHIAWF